jgi:hypothetical protein
MLNSDKPHLWDQDIADSIRLFNTWFMETAPQAYTQARPAVEREVRQAFRATADLTSITPAVLRENPGILPVLRSCTAPPIARDRLMGLARTTKTVISCLEAGKVPTQLPEEELEPHLDRICEVLEVLLDPDLFSWTATRMPVTPAQKSKAVDVVVDRRTRALADAIVRNAQEPRQLAVLEEWLRSRGYQRAEDEVRPGTYAFRRTLILANGSRMPIDAVVQPHHAGLDSTPVLIEAKSAGDTTNTNKRRKEEADKLKNLQSPLVLLLCGYFNRKYLEHEVAAGLDFVWEHRLRDLAALGI